jgi:hypothetical protein
MKRPVVVQPRREAPILVCKKCLKRSPDGAKIRRRLKRELKSAANGTKKASRLVTTGCFKICPKAAVVLTGSQTLAWDEYVRARVASRGRRSRSQSSQIIGLTWPRWNALRIRGASHRFEYSLSLIKREVGVSLMPRGFRHSARSISFLSPISN